jgi:uncharacterized protein (UPF0210 family)
MSAAAHRIRTVNLGLKFEPAAPARACELARRFFAVADAAFADADLAPRTRRVTTQPCAGFAPGAAGLVPAIVALERELDGIWLCVPGPQFQAPGDEVSALDWIADAIAETENVFTNTLIGSRRGIHLDAIERVGRLMREIASIDDNGQGNFRFAAIANVRPGTPYFPAAVHEGDSGFSVALELAGIADAAFRSDLPFEQKLRRFASGVAALAREAAACSQRVEAETGVRFLGLDFSLAPFPGARTSAVGALESLQDTVIGSADFILSFHAVNQVLANAAPEVPRVGYNGTMLSVAEDDVLARRVAERAVGIKDLLLYATVCGCGLDMLPLPPDTSAAQLSTLVRAVSVISHRWDKPLIARLLPTPLDADGRTCFRHDFLVNTVPFAADAIALAAPTSGAGRYYTTPTEKALSEPAMETL